MPFFSVLDFALDINNLLRCERYIFIHTQAIKNKIYRDILKFSLIYLLIGGTNFPLYKASVSMLQVL